MILSNVGNILATEWLKSFEIRHELVLHEYVIMPNHLHAIVKIDRGNRGDGTGRGTYGVAAAASTIESQDEILQIKRNPPIRLPKSISSFIAGFKSAVNTKIDDYIDEHQSPIPKYNRNNHFFQPNYHDHIIRNGIEYRYIAAYIVNNPNKWGKDKFNLSTRTDIRRTMKQ